MTITAPEMTESDHADNPTITVRSVDQQDNSIRHRSTGHGRG